MAAKKKGKKRHPAAKKTQTPPPKKNTVVGMMVKIYLIHLAAFLFYTVVGMLFINSPYQYIIATVTSVLLYLGLCYVIALRAGNRDRKYEEISGERVDGRNGMRAAALSQCVGLVMAIILQFKTSGKVLDAYEILYMPFSYLVESFKNSTRFIYFLPLIFAPIMFTVAYYTGR
ncbi:MAG: hypothetical protein II784_06115, partial [Oscillospiraceae bacterium]|nr:hypothetical protein [Oscillospiraceae bacterium]